MDSRILPLLVAFSLTLVSDGFANENGEVVRNATNSFFRLDAQFDQLPVQHDFVQQLIPQGLGVKASTEQDINASLVIPNLGKGDPKESYDVILQPGHYGRTTGKVGTAGQRISEQRLAAFLVSRISSSMAKQKLKVLVIPADGYSTQGLHSHIFLAIHADGSEKPCTTGPSLGYSDGSSLLGMHTVAYALATSLGQTYDEFKKDNFTVNEQRYYAFRHIKSSGFSGLLEVGELTCSATENALIENAALIAENLAIALMAAQKIQTTKLEDQ